MSYIRFRLGSNNTDEAQIFDTLSTDSMNVDVVINFAARFASSLGTLIKNLALKESMPIDVKELHSFKVIFEKFIHLLNLMPDNEPKEKAKTIVKRAVDVINKTENSNASNLRNQLEILAKELRPFIAAEELSGTNDAPIGESKPAGTSKNELLKARLAQARLSETEKRLDQMFAERMIEMEKVRNLTARLASLDFKVAKFPEITKVLRAALSLLARLRTHWHQLLQFFSDLSAKIDSGLDSSLTNFVNASKFNITTEVLEINRKLMAEFLDGDAQSIYRETSVLFVMSKTYYQISRLYLLPSLASLSLLLTAADDSERRDYIHQLDMETKAVQGNVTELIEYQRNKYLTAIRERRAEINERIDEQGADSDEFEELDHGKELLNFK